MLQTLCIEQQELDFLISRPQLTDAEKSDKLFQTATNNKNNSDSSKLPLWVNTETYMYIIACQLSTIHVYLQSEQMYLTGNYFLSSTFVRIVNILLITDLSDRKDG